MHDTVTPPGKSAAAHDQRAPDEYLWKGRPPGPHFQCVAPPDTTGCDGESCALEAFEARGAEPMAALTGRKEGDGAMGVE